MDDYEVEVEYDDERFFEDKYNDDFDALNDFDNGSTVKSASLSSTKTANGSREESFKKLTSTWSYTVDGNQEESLRVNKTPESKKQKIQDDSDDELEEGQHLPQHLPNDILVTKLPSYQKNTRKYVYQLPQFGKDCLTVTDTEGRRVYLPIKEVTDKETTEAKPQVNKHDLLSIPIQELIQIVENKRHSELMEKVNDIKNSLNSIVDDEIIERGESVDIEMIDKEEPENSLWVEKYHPRRFTELLSDDGINRILLKWIKLWDQFVFGRSKKKIKTSNQEKANQSETKKRFGKRKQNYDYEEEMELDHTGRPKYKIALLSGNPGLGKTTLAHIVARHAGYNPVEMNASDDRSAELFKNKLETTTQMISCMGEGNRPNCLIIDEIDGAPVQAINILLQTVKDTEESTKKKKKSKQITVTRPIICICNDLYVPALKQLRQTALSLSVPQVAPSRLAQRLLEISRKQKMKADMGCLLALCDKSENDIRSCVNTLQFIFTKHGELNATHLQDISIGQKDFHKGLFFVLKSVFQLPKSSRRHFGFLQNVSKNGLAQNRLALSGVESETGAMQTSNSIRFHNILHLASSNSEFEKMAQGLFDNYLNVKSKDPHLDSVVNCTSWLQFGDRLETKIRSEQNYSLMKFYPFLPVAFHMMLAGALPQRLTYSNSAIEFNARFSRLKQIWETVACDVKPAVKRNVGNVSAILDHFPYIYEIVHPTLRPVNIQLYSTTEKEQLSNLVSTMISYNLSYHQERNSDGQYTYVLLPNIGEIISFPNLPQHKQLSYAAKQLIQREIDLEKMRKIENSLQQMEIDTEKSGKGKSKAKQIRKPEKLQPVAVKHENTKPTLDFFGREIVIPKDAGRAVEKKNSLINTKVWYKFNEGYSNAVRRKVRIQDFL